MELVAEKYKQSDVGLIPSDWEVRTIGSFTDVCAGGTPSTFVREFWNGDIRWMNSGELNLKQVFEVENRITELGLNNSATRLIPVNCILIGLAGQGKTRGTVAINKIELCTNQSIAAIFPCDKVDYNFLYFNLDSRYSELRGLSTGDGGRGGLNLTIIKNLKIPLPPTKAEQTAIATALSDMDALIAQTEKLIEKKKAIKQGVMQELLRPKEGWVNKKLGDFGKTYGGITGKGKADFGFGGSRYIPFMNIMANPVIDIEHFDVVNINSGEFQNKVQCGDLFFNGSSETPEEVGLCSVLDKDVNDLYLNSFCFGYRMNNANDFNGYFLAYLFRSPLGRKLIYSLAQGATRYNLSKTSLMKLELPIPNKKEQDSIANIIIDIDNEISIQNKKLQKLKLEKQGMMQALLTGKIRLV